MPKSRLFLGVVGAVLAPAAFAQTWEDKVTLTTGARPVGEVVAELAKATGLPMSISGLIKNDIVFVSLKDVTARVAAEKLAKATGGRWVEEGGVSQLLRTPADERKQWELDAKARKGEIEASIAAGMAGLEKGRLENGKAQGMRAALMTLALIPEDQLAGLEPDQRVVYASRATPMQRSLPGAAMNIARQNISDEIGWRQAAIERSSNPRETQSITRDLERLRRSTIGKVLLVVQNQGGQALMVRLNVLDPNGQMISSADVAIQTRPTRRGNASATAGGNGLQFSARAKAMAQLWRESRNGEVDGIRIGEVRAGQFARTDDPAEGVQAEQIEDAIRAQASRPDLNEPLDYFIAEMLRLAAEAEGAGIVACLPDSAMQPAALVVASDASAKKVWSELAGLQMQATLEDGIYIVSPLFPSTSRYERMNRAAAAALMAEASKKGFASLEDLGLYAMASSRGGFCGPLDQRLIGIGHPEAGSGLRRNQNNQEALAIFAALGSQRRETMMRGQTSVPVSLLNAQDEAAWLTFNSPDGPVWRNPDQRRGRGQNTRDGLTRAGQVFASTEVPDLQQGRREDRPLLERTELLPNGLPAATTVSLSGQFDSILRSSENQDQTARTASLSPEALGAQRAQRDSPAFAEQRARTPEYRVFTVGDQGTYAITISYGDNYVMTRTLREVQIRPDSQPVAYGDLPQDIRTRIEKAYARTFESLKNARNGGNRNDRTGRTPPP